MSNSNNTMQTQTSNALHNAIMEAGGKDHPPMLAPGNDIYSTVDACPNLMEMWKAIERLKQGESINVQDLETNLYWKFRKFTSRDESRVKDCLLPQTYDNLKKHQNEFNEIRAEILARTANLLDNSLRINRVTGYDNQRASNVAGARKTVGRWNSVECRTSWRDDTDDEPKDQELGAHYMYMAKIQKVTPNVADNSGPVFDLEPLQKVQYDKDSYNVFANDRQHPEQHESVNDTPADWRDDTDDKPEDQELEAHYFYMAKIQEVTPDAADKSGPIFDTEPLQKADQDDDDLV
nr:hypothetical protein [Tanacetum cinerariifolium]